MDDLFDINPSNLYCSSRTDGGKEFMAKPITETIVSYGYHHEKTAADTSFQNGIVERPHRTLKEKMRCMLYSSRLGVEFWVDAIMHAV